MVDTADAIRSVLADVTGELENFAAKAELTADSNVLVNRIVADSTALANKLNDTIAFFKERMCEAINSELGTNLHTTNSAETNMGLLKQAVEDSISARIQDSIAAYKSMLGIEVSNVVAYSSDNVFTIRSATRILSGSFS